MLEWEEVVEADALRKRGWSISPIAGIWVGTTRRTGRIWPASGRPASGRRRGWIRSTSSERYVAARFVDDAHVAATALYDEIAALGYPRSYQTFTRQLRVHVTAGPAGHCAAHRSITPTM